VSKGVEPVTVEQYAIFQTGGKQYQAIVGKTVAIEKLEGEPGAQVLFDQVLFRKEASGKFEVGKPFLQEPIKAIIVRQDKAPKVIAFRFKRRHKVRVKRGHRQPLTVVRIESI
jgi:large subunit ribosomal protein L21